MKKSPQELLDMLRLYQISCDFGNEIQREFIRERGSLTFITTYNGKQLSFYHRFEIVEKRILMQRVQHLLFLSDDIDMRQVESFTKAKLYFYRLSLRRSDFETRFVHDWEMTIGPDRFNNNNVLRLESRSDAQTWEDFKHDFDSFTEETIDFSMKVLQELYEETTAILVDASEGSFVTTSNERGQA